MKKILFLASLVLFFLISGYAFAEENVDLAFSITNFRSVDCTNHPGPIFNTGRSISLGYKITKSESSAGYLEGFYMLDDTLPRASDYVNGQIIMSTFYIGYVHKYDIYDNKLFWLFGTGVYGLNIYNYQKKYFSDYWTYEGTSLEADINLGLRYYLTQDLFIGYRAHMILHGLGGARAIPQNISLGITF